jgi:UDP-2,3-diacylglucosamine hydrolase
MITSLFISDLHLHPGRPEGVSLFDDFIATRAGNANQLFILGDLFEYWLGDDASEHCGYQPVIDSLSALARQKTKVFFMHGNRDFLIGSHFAADIGGFLLPEPTKIRLDGHDVLLMHGDSLCTDDTEHQKFRELTRSKEWQQNILSKSIAEREELARQFRMASMKGNAQKTDAIMDVNQDAVETAMRVNQTRLLIHGHTHRPAIHDFLLGTEMAHRVVLGDWYTKGNYLVHDQNGFRLIDFPGDTLLAALK